MVKYGNTLESSRKDGRLANTDNIYDKRTGEMQEAINQKIANVSTADEEDLTKTIDKEGRSVTKFADRSYSPSNFSGKGYKILRKNIQKVSLAVVNISVNTPPASDGYVSFIINGIETHVDLVASTDNTTDLVAEKIASKLAETMAEYDVSHNASLITLTRKFGGVVPLVSSFSANSTGMSSNISDSTKLECRNIITSNMINTSNTIYEIRYDFDLNGQSIELQQNCLLQFNGGSIKNGSLISTIINMNIFALKNVNIYGKLFINNDEYTTYGDKIVRHYTLMHPIIINTEEYATRGLYWARKCSINDFCLVVQSEDNLTFDIKSFIKKYKPYIRYIKLHPQITTENLTRLKNFITLVKSLSPSVFLVTISNEDKDYVSSEGSAKILADFAEWLHSIGLETGVSANYHYVYINKVLKEKLDYIGYNYYPPCPWMGTDFDSMREMMKNSLTTSFWGNAAEEGKKLMITESGCRVYKQSILAPSDWQIQKMFPCELDNGTYMSMWYKTVIDFYKLHSIKMVTVWYMEELGWKEVNGESISSNLKNIFNN